MKTKFLIITTSIILFILAFLAQFFFDNKYTMTAPQSQDNAMIIDKQTLNNNFIYLDQKWNFYPDQLIDQKDLNKYPSYSIKIGEYPNLSSFHQDSSPYGKATYHLSLKYDDPKPMILTLNLPEIFSAYNIYLNDTKIASMGSIDPYLPQVKETQVSFTISHDSDLIIHTNNQSHYYSGLNYPIALGSTNAIHDLTTKHLLIYSLAAFSSITIALFCLNLWFKQKPYQNKIYYYYGSLTLAFGINILYPFLHQLNFKYYNILYIIEDFSSGLIIYLISRIITRLLDQDKNIYFQIYNRILLMMAIVIGFFPTFILPSLPLFTNSYSTIISLYKLFNAIFFMILSIIGFIKQKKNFAYLLSGTTCFAAGLFLNVVLINQFEPAWGLWQHEIGNFYLILCFGIMMYKQNQQIINENIRLNNHLYDEVEKQTNTIKNLIKEKDDLLSNLIHDLKSPMTSLLAYVQLLQEDQKEIKEKNLKMINLIEQKCYSLKDQVSLLNQATGSNIAFDKTTIDLSKLIKNFYLQNKPDMEVYDVDLTLDSKDDDIMIYGNQAQLNQIFTNLTYNALDYLQEDNPTINLSLTKNNDFAIIKISDNGKGIAPDVIDHIFTPYYTTNQRDDSQGLGLHIVKTAVEAHLGTIKVTSILDQGTTFTIQIPLIK